MGLLSPPGPAWQAWTHCDFPARALDADQGSRLSVQLRSRISPPLPPREAARPWPMRASASLVWPRCVLPA